MFLLPSPVQLWFSIRMMKTVLMLWTVGTCLAAGTALANAAGYASAQMRTIVANATPKYPCRVRIAELPFFFADIPDPLRPAERSNRATARWTLLDRHGDRRGRNSIRHHDQAAGARLHSAWNIEVRRDNLASGRNPHRAVIVRARIEHMTGAVVGDADKRIVRRGLQLVAERVGLRQSVELRARDLIARTARDGRGRRGDGRLPGRLIGAGGAIDLRAADKDLSGRQDHQAVAAPVHGLGREVGAVELVKRPARALNEYVSVREQLSEIVSGVVVVGEIGACRPAAAGRIDGGVPGGVSL